MEDDLQFGMIMSTIIACEEIKKENGLQRLSDYLLELCVSEITKKEEA